jgi:hypothetical protein
MPFLKHTFDSHIEEEPRQLNAADCAGETQATSHTFPLLTHRLESDWWIWC